MKQEKIDKFIEDMDYARYLYHTTTMKISQIARSIKRSVTTVDNMITGNNLPKYLKPKNNKGVQK